MRILLFCGAALLDGCGSSACEESVQAFCGGLLRCRIVDSKGFDSCVTENRKRVDQLKLKEDECRAGKELYEKMGCCDLGERAGVKPAGC